MSLSEKSPNEKFPQTKTNGLWELYFISKNAKKGSLV